MVRHVHARPFALLLSSAIIVTGFTTAAPASGGEFVKWVNLANVTDDAGYPQTAESRAWGYAIEAKGQHIAVVWRDTRAGDAYTTPDADVELRESLDNGATWGPLRNLTNSDGKLSGYPDVALSRTATVVASTTAEVAWGSHPHLVINRVAPGEEPSYTALPIESSIQPKIASNGATNFHVVGGSGDYSEGYVTYTRSWDDGRTWSSPVDISGPFTNAESVRALPAVAADAVVVASSWSAIPPGQTRADVYVATSNDRGRTFRSPVRLEATPYSESDPAVAVDGETVVIAWESFQAVDRTQVMVATSTDSGATFGPARVVATITSEATPCRGCGMPGAFLTVADGAFHLTPRHGVRQVLTSEDGVTWPSRATLFGGTDIAVSGGEVWAASNGYVLRAVEDVVPGRVARPTVTVDRRKAIITWTRPRNDGSRLTGYRVTVD